MGFPPGLSITDVGDTPNDPDGYLLSRCRVRDKLGRFNTFRLNPQIKGMLFNPNYHLGKVVYITNGAGTKGGFYLEQSFYLEVGLPPYKGADHMELLNGSHYSRTPLNRASTYDRLQFQFNQNIQREVCMARWNAVSDGRPPDTQLPIYSGHCSQRKKVRVRNFPTTHRRYRVYPLNRIYPLSQQSNNKKGPNIWSSV